MGFDLFATVQVVAGPIVGATTGAVLGWLLGRKQRKIAEVHASADQTDAITRRFEALMNGYEARINDLVREVERLRDLIAELQHQLQGSRDG